MIFEHKVYVEFGDCDPAGIVFYPNFYRWFDAACWRMFESIDCSRKTMNAKFGIIGIPLVDAHCRFLKPVRDGGTIVVESCIGEWRQSSFTVLHRVMAESGICATGSETRVWAGLKPGDQDSLIPLEVPEEIRLRIPAQGELPD